MMGEARTVRSAVHHEIARPDEGSEIAAGFSFTRYDRAGRALRSPISIPRRSCTTAIDVAGKAGKLHSTAELRGTFPYPFAKAFTWQALATVMGTYRTASSIPKATSGIPTAIYKNTTEGSATQCVLPPSDAFLQAFLL